MPREDRAQTTGATGDQHRPVRVQRRRHGEHQLADVAALAQLPERLRAAAHVPAPGRQVRQHPRVEEPDDLAQHLLDPLRAGLEQVEGGGTGRPDAAPRPRPRRGRRPCPSRRTARRAAAAPATRRRTRRPARPAPRPRRRRRWRPGSGPGTPGPARTRCGRRHAGRPHGVPLRRARGREDLGAEVPGELHRGHAHPAGGGVHQHPLTGAQTGQVDQPVVRGQEDHRHRGRLLEREARRHRHDHPPVGHRDGAERVHHQTHHPVARRQVGHRGPDLQHHPGRLAAQRRVTRVHAQRDQHVAEVQPGGPDPEPDLARGQRPVRIRGDDGQALQGALPLHPQPPRTRRWQRRRPTQPRRPQPPLADRQLRLAGRHDRGPVRLAAAVDIDQHDPAGVLGLRAADQPPDRGQRRVRGLRAHRHRAAGEHRQPRPAEPVAGQPPLHQLQRPPGHLDRRRPGSDLGDHHVRRHRTVRDRALQRSHVRPVEHRDPDRRRGRRRLQLGPVQPVERIGPGPAPALQLRRVDRPGGELSTVATISPFSSARSTRSVDPSRTARTRAREPAGAPRRTPDQENGRSAVLPGCLPARPPCRAASSSAGCSPKPAPAAASGSSISV